MVWLDPSSTELVLWEEGKKETEKVANHEKVVASMHHKSWGGGRTDGIGLFKGITKKEYGGGQKLWLEKSCIIATNNNELK